METLHSDKVMALYSPVKNRLPESPLTLPLR